VKTYDEMTASVLTRRDAYVNRKKKQRNILTSSALACITAAVCLLAVEVTPHSTPHNTPHITPSATSSTTPSETVTLSMESRMYLATNGQQTLLAEGMKLPSAYSLSVQDIRGLSEEEIDSVYTIEQEAAQNIVYEHADTIAHANTLRRENVVVSLVRLGTFELEIDDPKEVAFISGKTTTEYGRVEFFYQSDAIPKDEYGPFSDNEMTLSGEYYQILVQQQQNGKGRLEINWRPSSLLYDTIDQDPDRPLSTFRDTFLLMVEYSDGSLEEHVVEIAFDDDGNAAPRYVYKQEIPLSEEKE